MDTNIFDSLPDASPGRTAYLRDRIQRVFADHTSTVRAVELRLERDPDEGRVLADLRVTTDTMPPIVVQARRQRLPDALAQAFDAAELRLRVGAPAPQPAA